jgi:microcystin-dependent protein
MTLIVYPFRPVPGDPEDVTQIMMDFDAVTAVVNGQLTSENFAPGGLNDDAALGPTVQQQLVPTGVILPFGGSTAPTGFLICDGASVAVVSYPDLHAVIGYAYGGSGGSFNLPSLAGRVPVGLHASDGRLNALGKMGGEFDHALSAAEMPSHTHQLYFHPNSNVTGAGYNIVDVAPVAGGGTGEGTYPTGGNAVHNNLQPFTVVNYIIKT